MWIFYQRRQQGLCCFSFSESCLPACVRVSSWQNVLLEALTVPGTTKMVFSNLASIYTSIYGYIRNIKRLQKHKINSEI